jgi:integrase
MTGVFNKNPPVPKYTDIWDVDTVLQYLTQLGDNRHLEDKVLTHKTAMLLALTTAARASELQALDLEHFSDRGDVIEFVIPGLTKTRKPGGKAMTFAIQQFPDPLLDVVTAVRMFIQRTAAWRTTRSRHKLFLTTTGQHTPVATSTISRWLVKLMSDAGIDTSQYKGHSTRAAAVSKAAAGGMSVQDILTRANWSNAGTFKKYYYRESKSSDDVGFETRVLSQR